jgi:TrmH family RNA methyltransferase
LSDNFLSKAKIKWIRSLQHKKYREEMNQFVIEGEKMVKEALNDASLEIVLLASTECLSYSNNVGEFYQIDQQTLKQISSLTTPNKSLAVINKRKTAINHYPKLVLAVDGVQDPGNLGTIIRTADWFGIQVIICSFDTVDCYNQKVLQATMGSWNRVQIEYHSLNDILPQLNKPIYGALLNGTPLQKTTLTHEGILVVGNEGQGISNAVEAIVTNPISINGFGGAESLNVAVATGILLHELTKVS